ncbi:MAG: spermidine synthase [Chloroflexota bacterium]|nr:spermidine synthase [Chloroflexota bacterium]
MRRASWPPFLARNDVRLFLTSFAILYVELLLIRWIPSNVRYIGFFSNFLLIASFLGIGLGILLGRRGANPRLSPFAFLFAGVAALIYQVQLNVQVQSTDELFFGLAESTAANINFLVLPLAVALVVALLASLALPLGPLLKSMRPLKAYAIDIIGSMSGIAGFAILSALGTEPLVWFTVAAGLVMLVELGRNRLIWALANGVVLLGVVGIVAANQAPVFWSREEVWSPYYRIDSHVGADGVEQLWVDGIPHQALHPVDKPNMEPFYEQVYRWFPDRVFERVLVVGAGSGSDVAIALSRGAQHVDAVEIDPELMRVGRERHPNRPYDDPRVTRHINDGRAFLRTIPPATKYDLVLFALPDSLTLVSSQSAIRLESFLFTEQAFEAVRERLTDDGIFVLYNYYRQEWLITKLGTMLEEVFAHPPLVQLYGARAATLAAGPLVESLPRQVPPGGSVESPDRLPPGEGVDPAPQVGVPQPVHATDDWPFLYLRTPFIADYYLAALGIVLLLALMVVAGAAKVTGTTIRRFSPHFFVLGVAFLLLTTRSLVSFSLLFGTTWVVNAMAFFAILASVLLAIFVNARWPIRRPTIFYLLLFASIALAFLLPPESLLFDPPWLRYAVAAAIAFAPVFFANLVFSYSFRDTATADMAFASNLLGAMVGGALEYLALITGYRFLLVVVALLYALAWLFATRLRVLADTELATDTEREATAHAPAPQPLPPEPAA